MSEAWRTGSVDRQRAIINADLERRGKNRVFEWKDGLAFANQVRPTYDAFRTPFATEASARRWIVGIARHLQ